MLHFVIQQATGLAPDQQIDPFVCIKLDTDPKRSFLTEVVNDNNAPFFVQGTGSLKSVSTDTNLTLKVYNYKGSINTLLGQRSIPLAGLKDGKLHQKRIQLNDEWGMTGSFGEVLLVIVWDANGQKEQRATLLDGPISTETAPQTPEHLALLKKSAALEHERIATEAHFAAFVAKQRGDQVRAVAAAAAEQRARAARVLLQSDAHDLDSDIDDLDPPKPKLQDDDDLFDLDPPKPSLSDNDDAKDDLDAPKHLIPRLNPGESANIGNGTIKVGLSWDGHVWDAKQAAWTNIDLDSSCLAFSASGDLLDACYFASLSAFNESLQHSGDSEEGGALEDDESITIQLHTLPPQVHTLFVVVSSFCCFDFDRMNLATTHIYLHNQIVASLPLPTCSRGSLNTLLACRLTRTSQASGTWVLTADGIAGTTSSFLNTATWVRQQFASSFAEHKNTTAGPMSVPSSSSASSTSSIHLSKAESVALASYERIWIGLGWDAPATTTEQKIDLDASLAVFGGENYTLLEKISYRKKESEGKLIIHQGDCLTGAGDGDDEKILVQLGSLPTSVTGLGICITSFRQQTFDTVQNAYVRLVLDDDTEIARFNLSELGPYTAYAMATLSRGCVHKPHSNDWTMNAVGLPGFGKTITHCVDILQAVLRLGSSHGRTDLKEAKRFLDPSRSQLDLSEEDEVVLAPGTWACRDCSCHNPDTASTCSACGTQKPSNQAMWACSACTFENPITAAACSICQAVKPSSPWNCTVCTFENASSATACSMCGAAR
jgi:tellurium resistance protein TerZ